MRKRWLVIGPLLVAVVLYLSWRMVRPMNVFVVSPAFERPIDTSKVPDIVGSLSAEECAVCHQDIYDEWVTTMHAESWTDPYFQVDFAFDGNLQICKNCHTPLDRQQEYLVLGFRDRDKFDPILEPNPDFDAELRDQGITCAACHLKEGRIVATRRQGPETGPEQEEPLHPITRIDNGNQICIRCHVVGGDRWDTFFRFPPCGTVAEIRSADDPSRGWWNRSAYDRPEDLTVAEIADLNCVECHMPRVDRPVAEGGQVRPGHRHLWLGGHDPGTVRQALDVDFREEAGAPTGKRRFAITLSNEGAAHYVPTGTPDRHLVVRLRLLAEDGSLIEERKEVLKRTVMWRPFIVDLWDTRLPPRQPRTYDLVFAADGDPRPAAVEAVIRYFLVDDTRRKRIGYENAEPVSYDVFRQTISLSGEAGSGETSRLEQGQQVARGARH